MSAEIAVRLCRIGDIADGRARGFDPRGEGCDTMFVVAHGGRLFGWRNACPHIDGAPMAWRKDAYLNGDGTRIVCYAHGAHFLPDSGRCIQGPCVGRSLVRVPLEIDGAGEVFTTIRTSVRSNHGCSE